MGTTGPHILFLGQLKPITLSPHLGGGERERSPRRHKPSMHKEHMKRPRSTLFCAGRENSVEGAVTHFWLRDILYLVLELNLS